MLIYFCDTCKARIPAAEIETQAAVFVGENKALCAKCAAVRKSNKSSRTSIRAATHIVEGIDSSAAVAIAARGEDGETAVVPPPNLKLAVLVGCVGLILFVIGLFVALSGGESEDAHGEPVRRNGPEASSRAGPPAVPAVQPVAARGKPEPAEHDPKPPTQVATEVTQAAPPTEVPVDPPKTAPAVAPAESAKSTPKVVPAEPGETIWVEDALPPGASGDGTLKADSWKWVPQPALVFSGTRSHTMNVGEGQPNPQGLQRHSFQGANPPLQVGPSDTLFTYTYLDPQDPPKELMLEWQFRGGWEHRAYWGQDEIQAGSNFSPSRLQAGPLPKTGAWVRLGVRASEIGVEAEQEPVTGWSFVQFGGVAYWDRAGVLVKLKPAAVAEAHPPVPVPPLPQPIERGTAPPVTPASPAPAQVQPGAGCKLSWKDFKGGGTLKEKKPDGKEARAIWAKSTQKNFMHGTFELAARRYGFGPAELVTTTLLQEKQPCQIAVALNGKQVFHGRDIATKKGQWGEQQYPIPAGVLHAGTNEIRIENLEPAGELNQEPWYMLHAVEVVLPADFPLIVSEAQRAAIQAYEGVEQIAKKELDPAAKLVQELRLAKGATAPELQPLAAVLEKAQALYNQALANIAKAPPVEEVKIEKLKQAVHLVRVAGGKAYIKSQGMEMPVDVAWLPQSIFLKALACDESKPAGLADKAAFCFALGNEDPAQALLKRSKKEELPAWVALFEHRKTLNALARFEASVNNVEALLKSAKPADALTALVALKKEHPDLAEANKERLNSLTTAAEAAKNAAEPAKK